MTLSIPVREPADFRFTVRQSNWQGGYNRLYYQIINALTEPRFWDSFNIDTSRDGDFSLAPLFEIVQTDASDKKPLLRSFNSSLYRLEGVSTPAVQKTSDGTTWNTVSMTSGPTTAIRGAVVWRNNLVVAANSNTIYNLDSSDTWTSLTAPTGITEVCDMVGISPDDRLLAWFNGKGLYQTEVQAPAAGDWDKVCPAVGDPDEAQCDLIDGSTGTGIIATSDAKGSSLHEYFTAEGAATAASMVTWIHEDDTFFYVSKFYSSASYLGSKKGQGGGRETNGQGLLWRKERGAKPILVQEIGDGIRGAVASDDFGIKALVNDGTNLWVGAPSRAENFSDVKGIPCVYWYNVDQQGVESISPNSALDVSPGNVAGPVYDAAIINGEVVITTGTGTWKRSKTKYSSQGKLDSSLYDLRSPDHEKAWRFTELLVEDATSTETVTFYYRTGTLAGSWLGGTAVAASGAHKIVFPDDNASQAEYKLNARQLQTQIKLARGATETLSPRVTSLAVDAAQIRAVGS